jgi:hypothetical protein
MQPPFDPSPMHGSDIWNWKFTEKGAATLYWVLVHAAPAGGGLLGPMLARPGSVVSVSLKVLPNMTAVPTVSRVLRGMMSAKAGVVAKARPRKPTVEINRI